MPVHKWNIIFILLTSLVLIIGCNDRFLRYSILFTGNYYNLELIHSNPLKLQVLNKFDKTISEFPKTPPCSSVLGFIFKLLFMQQARPGHGISQRNGSIASPLTLKVGFKRQFNSPHGAACHSTRTASWIVIFMLNVMWDFQF